MTTFRCANIIFEFAVCLFVGSLI